VGGNGVLVSVGRGCVKVGEATSPIIAEGVSWVNGSDSPAEQLASNRSPTKIIMR